MLADLIRANRTCRRFDAQYPITTQTLINLVDLARLSASAANLQPLKYILSNTASVNAKIFECLKWAYYLPDWPGPEPGERPTGYIVMLNDTRISKTLDCDHGIAAQSIMLGAREGGLAGCMLAAVNRPKLSRILAIADHFQIILVLAIGKPIEKVVVDDVDIGVDIRYWRDADHVHHVPKRRLEDIIVARYEI